MSGREIRPGVFVADSTTSIFASPLKKSLSAAPSCTCPPPLTDGREWVFNRMALEIRCARCHGDASPAQVRLLAFTLMARQAEVKADR